MVSFEIGTIIIAVVILLLCFMVIAFSLNKVKNDIQYPPVVSDCPDYWLDMSDGSGNKCVNKHEDLGNSVCATTMDFSESFWSGDIGLCRKKQWAKKCNLTWDGVTNNNKACNKLMDLEHL